MKWSLKRQAMDAQVLASQGDETAMSDIRAYIAARRKTKVRNRWKRKVRLMKRLLTSAAALVMAVALVGCKTTAPLSLTLATSTLIAYSSPETIGYLRDAHGIVCAFANGNMLDPNTLTTVIESSGIDRNKEGVAVMTGITLLYIAAYDSLGANTNNSAVRPYAQSICDGMTMALGPVPVPVVKARNAPPVVAKWRLLKR